MQTLTDFCLVGSRMTILMIVVTVEKADEVGGRPEPSGNLYREDNDKHRLEHPPDLVVLVGRHLGLTDMQLVSMELHRELQQGFKSFPTLSQAPCCCP